MVLRSFGRIRGLVWQCAVESKVDKASMTHCRWVAMPTRRSSEMWWGVRRYSDDSGGKQGGVKNVWR